mmetsp:Transcript_103179/g.205002  ORF Transcript_103179/g.205002 Transcript_103179/m.205002 type:complete len:86 (+) Transcript_103179:744-1001(+)
MQRIVAVGRKKGVLCILPSLLISEWHRALAAKLAVPTYHGKDAIGADLMVKVPTASSQHEIQSSRYRATPCTQRATDKWHVGYDG